MVQLRARGAREALDRAGLVDDEVVHVLRRDLHRPPAEALDVGKRRMRAAGDAVVQREAHGLADGRGIAAVEAAGDVGRADVRHDLGVGAHRPRAVALSHVAVYVYRLHSEKGVRTLFAQKGTLPFFSEKGPDPFFISCRTPRRCPAMPIATARAP